MSDPIEELRADLMAITIDTPGGSDMLIRSFTSGLERGPTAVAVCHHVMNVLSSVEAVAGRIESVGPAVRFLGFLDAIVGDERVTPCGRETVQRARRTVLDRFPGSGDTEVMEILNVMEA